MEAKLEERLRWVKMELSGRRKTTEVHNVVKEGMLG